MSPEEIEQIGSLALLCGLKMSDHEVGYLRFTPTKEVRSWPAKDFVLRDTMVYPDVITVLQEYSTDPVAFFDRRKPLSRYRASARVAGVVKQASQG